MRVTMQQIADRCGLSVETVSRVINNRKLNHVSVQNRERVRKAAEELGYMPNNLARAMRTGRFGSVALLLSTSNFTSALPAELLTGIYEALHLHDLHLLVARLPDNEMTAPDFAPRVLREWAVDGLLVNYTHAIPETLIERIRSHFIPSVWINSQQEADCIYPDDFRAAKEVVEYLLQLGHRAITYVVNSTTAQEPAHYSVHARWAGYEAGMRAAGREPHLFLENFLHPSREEMRQIRHQFLTSSQRPTALIGYSWRHLQPLAYTATEALGLKVPADLSLVCLDVTAMRDGLLNLTPDMWQVPNREVGMAAVKMLLAKIEQPEQSHPPQVIAFSHTAGASCAPPPRL